MHPYSDDDPQRVISELLKADVLVLAVQTPEDLLESSTREVLRTLFQAVGGQSSTLHIIVNNELCGTELGRRALETSFSKTLSTVLGAAPEGILSADTALKLHMVSSEAAIDAQAEFRRAQLEHALRPSSTAYSQSIDNFQRALQTSGLPQLSQSLQKSLSAFHTNADVSPSSSVQSSLKTALAATHRANDALRAADQEVKDAQARSSALRHDADSQIRGLRDELFRDGDLVTKSTESSRRMVDAYLKALPWWKLPWRVDEVASEVTGILNASYGRPLERNVSWRTSYSSEGAILTSNASSSITQVVSRYLRNLKTPPSSKPSRFLRPPHSIPHFS